MKLVLLVCSLLFVVGCERPYRWGHNFKTQTDYYADLGACESCRETSLYQQKMVANTSYSPYGGGINDAMLPIRQAENAQRAFENCMISKGWHKVFLDGK